MFIGAWASTCFVEAVRSTRTWTASLPSQWDWATRPCPGWTWPGRWVVAELVEISLHWTSSSTVPFLSTETSQQVQEVLQGVWELDGKLDQHAVPFRMFLSCFLNKVTNAVNCQCDYFHRTRPGTTERTGWRLPNWILPSFLSCLCWLKVRAAYWMASYCLINLAASTVSLFFQIWRSHRRATRHLSTRWSILRKWWASEFTFPLLLT